MRSKFKWIFTLLVAFTMQFSFAQQKTVTGVVSDALGPLAGANVVVKGTTNGTTTDFDGKYTIQAKQGDVLEISYTGMKNATVTVGASNVVNVTMKEDILTGGEVIVEGYRSVTKASSISSVVTVSAKELQNRPNVSFLNTLQGQAPGLLIGTSSGQPGSAKIDVIIRGISSLNSTTEPLYVIDGMPTNATQFRSLNPNDIESISVLKDAAAVAQYGNRGANGVIIINTKRGGYESAMTVSYNAMTGTSYLPTENYNMANAREVLTLQRRANIGYAADEQLTQEQIDAFPINTNWRDVFFRTSTIQNHDLGFRMGSKNMSNYTSIGYQQQDGIVPTTDFKRFSLRSNFNGKSNNEKFTYGSQIYAAYSKRNQLDEETNSGISNNVVQNPLHGAMTAMPYLPAGIYNSGQEVFDDIGSNFNGGNNIYVLEDILRPGNLPSYIAETKFMLNLQASYKLTKDLTFNSRTGFDYIQSNRVFARAPQSYLAIVVAANSGIEFGGFEDQSDDRDFTASQITSLNYNKTFGKHTVDVGLYTEYMKAHRYFKAFRVNGLDPRQYSPGSGTGWVPFNPANGNIYQRTASAAELNAGSFSYFGIADYDYDGKYGIGVSVRRDASYRFVDDNRWGTFWSIGGRWNIDKEAFMDGSVINMLKLRASYGKQGNQNVVGVGFGGNPIFTANNLVRDLNTAGAGYGNVPSLFLSNLANRDLKWEEILQSNIGIDFGVWKNKLEGNIDVYQKDTENMYIPTPVSAIVGVGSSYNANFGSMRNRGVEALLRYRAFDTDNFKFSVFANAAYNKNEITGLAGQDRIANGASQSHVVGQMAYQWNMVPYIGVNQSNGNMLFLDKDGNPTENPTNDDRRLLGKNQLPTYSGGFGFNADYKGFFMDANFVFFADVWRYDNNLDWYSDATTLAGYNVTTDLLNAWSIDNQNSSYPALNATNLGVDSSLSDRFLSDASYLRLRNVTLGYAFKKEKLQPLKLSNLRIFMQAENILTWTKWRGFDPDGFNASTLGGFPTPRQYSLGVNLEF